VSLSSAGLLEWTGSGTAATTADVIVEGTDDALDTDSSNAFDIVIEAAASNDIRLAIGAGWEEGGEFATQTARHWSVWEVDHSAMRHTGTTLSTNGGGVATIDIDASAHFVVGDDVYFTISFDDGETDPLDRTVRTVGGYITLTAQT
jgi:hypothetical protein